MIAPLIDNLWSFNSWITLGSFAMALICFTSAWVGEYNTYLILFCVLWMNVTSAVQDVAVDAYAISLLKPADLGKGSTLQVVGYKVGALFGGGILSWLSAYCSWEWLFTLWGSFYTVILIISSININNRTCLQNEATKATSLENQGIKGHQLCSSTSVTNDNTSGKLSPLQYIRTTITTVDFSWLMFCVMTYKLGEQGVVSMLPLYLIDQRVPQEQVGVIVGIFGQLFSIAGSTLGGWIVSLHYANRSWVIEVLIWTSYARLVPLLSLWLLSLTQFTKSGIAIIECFIQLSGGIITTATFTLMMQSSQDSLPGTKATHCAVLATSEVLGKLLMISLSGILVDITGYQHFFGLCFLLALSFLPVLKYGLAFARKKSS
ncbi:Major facilitator superfamily domain-containing protein 3 [Stylophora pistillata]|uniref:Major facilitator superfamily domain-containing protein 3 n=2 Tax=Stylophora pistillata TaxID=50429 RepID=A0A2B4RNZ3_STYPI|nr:Major facilitator superfamily domain-containing protein 3 [Stylophora pistillata]